MSIKTKSKSRTFPKGTSDKVIANYVADSIEWQHRVEVKLDELIGKPYQTSAKYIVTVTKVEDAGTTQP